MSMILYNFGFKERYLIYFDLISSDFVSSAKKPVEPVIHLYL